MRETGPLSTPSARSGMGFFRASLIGLALSLAVAACRAGAPATQAPTPTSAPTTAPTAAPTAAVAETPATPSFPRTVTDDEGAEVEISSEPLRIVSLTPANTEIVFALGAGDQLKGGTDYDDYPVESAALPDVVQGITVLTEQIVDLHPDLVLAGGNNFTPTADVQRLRDLDIPVLVVYPQTVDQVLADISLIGNAIGWDQSAADIVEGMQTRIDEVTGALEGTETPRTFYEIGFEPEIYGPAPQSFVADMVNLAGGDPITTADPAVFSIPLEQLVTADPEIIVLGDAAYGTCPDSIAGRSGWESMTAVVNGDIKPVDDTIVTRPGPRLAEGLAALALAIHPDADVSPPEAGNEYCTEVVSAQ